MSLIKFNVYSQQLRQYNSVVVAANSSSYLRVQFNFKTEDWAAVGTKTAYFIGSSRSWPVMIDENNQCLVPAEVIKAPSFGVTLTGGGITTNVVEIPVVDNGVGPMTPPAFTMDLYNQIIDKLDKLSETKADNIVYDEDDNSIQLTANGEPIGESITVIAASSDGSCGITTVEINDDGDLIVTLNNGRVINAGHVGNANGVTFIPHIDDDYILSWTNDGGLENPTPVDLYPHDEWSTVPEEGIDTEYEWEFI